MANAKAFTHEKRNVPTGRKIQPLLICPYCGRWLTLTSWGNAYRCGQVAISGIAECRTIHVDKERLENAVLSCTRAMAGLVAAETDRKKKEFSQTTVIEEKIRMMEPEKKKLSARKLGLYEEYQSGRICSGIAYILNKYIDAARKESPGVLPDGFSCHSMRHSKAMYMLQCDIPLVFIRDILGHNSVVTTEIYARVDGKKKREAIEVVYRKSSQETEAAWHSNPTISDFIADIRRI